MSYVRDFDDLVIRVLSIYSTFKKGLAVSVISQMARPDEAVVSRAFELDRLSSEYSRQLNAQLERLHQAVLDIAFHIALEPDDPNPHTQDPLTVDQRNNVSSFVYDIFDRLARSLAFQFESDTKQARIADKRLRMKLEMLRAMNVPQFVIDETIQTHAESFSTTRRDALGRSRDSEQFVMTELRYGAYRALNVSVLYMLAVMGESHAKIDRPGHRYDGVEFPIEKFEELEPETFHPNALAIVVPT